MFENFSQKLLDSIKNFGRKGVITQHDIETAFREIRIALLEANVSLSVSKDFIEKMKEKAIGANLIKSVSPEQLIAKIIHESLVEILGEPEAIKLKKKPTKILMVGLQGAGKTTTTAKVCKLLQQENKKNGVLASLDVYRPAAIEQLKVLSMKVNSNFFESSERNPIEIAKSALRYAIDQYADFVIFDTAGRLQIDQEKMDELREIVNVISPDEVILVMDIMMGQEGLHIAKEFNSVAPLTGMIFTRTDANSKAGVVLSVKSVLNCPIRYLCTGEALDKIELFDAEKIANKILDFGDISALVTKAQEAFSQEEMQKMSGQLLSNKPFTLNDLASQMMAMSKMGGFESILKMMPGGNKLSGMMNQHNIDGKMVTKSLAIISSMTKKERQNYKIIDGKRRKRIASGSGTTVQDVNALIKQYENTLTMMKKFSGLDGLMKLFGK